MESTKQPKVHYTANFLLNPPNPLHVHLIGAGGTGSQMLFLLARMHHALTQLGHAGFQVTVWDADKVSPANQGRQLFAESEIGLYKAITLVNRVNTFFGVNWNAIPVNYTIRQLRKSPDLPASANLFISCVDTVKARFEIAKILRILEAKLKNNRDMPYYWLDFGNNKHTGQVVLASVGTIHQPPSQRFTTVGNLPFVTDEFASLFAQADTRTDTPSCSLAEALTKQDLFINSTLANHGASLLWTLFREAKINQRGCFLNLESGRTAPLLLPTS